MSATIYHLSDYDRRLRRRRRRPPQVEDDHRQRAAATYGILIFTVVLIIIGVVLIDGIAAVGRSNSDCLQSGRRFADCSIRPSSRAGCSAVARVRVWPKGTTLPFINCICAPPESAVLGVSSNLTTGLSAHSGSQATERRAFVEARQKRRGTPDRRRA
jgi:hypothetical protein